MKKLRIILVDDHHLVREALKVLLGLQPDLELVGDAADGAAAISLCTSTRPDVALLDLAMPGLAGIAAAKEIRRLAPDTKILALTVHESEGYVRESFKAGAHGYLLKRASTDELRRAIRAVAGGEVYVDPRVSTSVIRNLMHPPHRSSAGDLSERETAVMRAIATGYANKEIAAKLNLSIKTVETYKARSMEKLGLKDRVDIVRLACVRGWFSDEVPV